MPAASPFLSASFAALAVLVAFAFTFALYRARVYLGAEPPAALRTVLVAGACVAIWLAITGAAAHAGLLAFGTMPPPLGVLFILILTIAASVSFSPVGRWLGEGLPLAALVGFHAFRLPLELLMHRAYTEGIMPVQMSYSGLNFDILTGASAIVLGALLLAGKAPLWVVRVWNVLGALLLANIATIAWLSTPTPMRVFMNEPANVWITDMPFVWLPSVMVLAALMGHLVLARRLRMEVRSQGLFRGSSASVFAAQ